LHHEQLLSSGGDERIDLLNSGKHKYHLAPIEHNGLFSRGSCTCSSLNPQSSAKLESFCDYISSEPYHKVRNRQSQRLKDLLNYEDQDAFDVIFAPSGSDLAYLPSIITEILQPGKKQLVLLTCPEELGSGSQMAFLGKYFGDKNQFGKPVEKGEDINPNYNISLSRFTARSKDGLIIDHATNIKDEIDKHPQMAKIGALVIGSKSGIEDDISLIPKIDKNVMWVVDLCQFRNSKKLVNELLEMNCMVMITGSKFYMAPPFCGMMLIPKGYGEKISEVNVDPSLIKGFDNIFSYYDFPAEYENLRKFFPKKENIGLTLRWEIAIDEMERFNAIPVSDVNSLLYKWNDVVNQEISTSKYFELMPHQDQTNSTIVSFKVKHPEGGYLEYDDLRKFFKFVVDQKHDCFDRFEKVFFGQPVRYGHGAFIRLALGSNNIYNLLRRDSNSRFKNDRVLVKLLDRKVIEFVEKTRI
jgi:hypothetical protein